MVFDDNICVIVETWIELVKPKKSSETDKQHLRHRSYFTVKLINSDGTLILRKENILAEQ